MKVEMNGEAGSTAFRPQSEGNGAEQPEASMEPVAGESQQQESGAAEEGGWWEKGPSEDALRGESEEPVRKEPETPGTQQSDPSRPSGEGEQERPEGSDRPEQGDAPSEKAKPEAGGSEPDPADEPQEGDRQGADQERMVPLKALHAERARRKELQERLADVETRLKARQVKPAGTDEPKKAADIPDDLKPVVEDFQRKNPEYAHLAVEDSPDGARIRRRLVDYDPDLALDCAMAIQADRQLREQVSTSQQRHEGEYLNACIRELNGLFPEGSAGGETASKAVAYAGECGLDSETVGLLTSPSTIIIDPESGKQVHLGRKAVEVAGFLKDAYDLSCSTNPEAVRKSIADSLRAEITAELAEKMRGTRPETSFRGLGDGPGGGERPQSGGPLSEAEFAKLSPADQERLLRGE